MPCRLKKRCYTCGRNLVPHPLVDPGNSPHRHEARTTAHPTRPRHRMVALAACPPGRGATRPPQKQNATVMLASGLKVAVRNVCLGGIGSLSRHGKIASGFLEQGHSPEAERGEWFDLSDFRAGASDR